EFVRSDLFRRTGGPDRLFRPQSLWLLGAEGELLVDNVLEVRGLDQSLPALLRSIGVPADKLAGTVEELNVSTRERVGTIGDAAAREVMERYREDYQLLGYPPAS